MRRIVLPFLLVFLLTITACTSSTSTSVNPKVLPTSTPPPQPQSGMATIIGQVMHEQGYPMTNTIIRLADVARGAQGRGGAFILDLARSPGTTTDDNGYFNIQNFDAGEYVIVIGDVEMTGTYEIIEETNGSAKVWNLLADQVTDIGILTVNIELPTPFPTAIPGQYPAPTAYPYP